MFANNATEQDGKLRRADQTTGLPDVIVGYRLVHFRSWPLLASPSDTNIASSPILNSTDRIEAWPRPECRLAGSSKNIRWTETGS